MTLRLKITYERSLIIKSGERLRGWCRGCNAEVEFVSSAELTKQSERMGSGTDGEKLHRSTAADGSTYICLRSMR